MINQLIRFSIRHSGLVLIVTIMLAFFGWVSFQTLPIDAVPDITNVQVQIHTHIPGLVPEEIERTVTFPLEVSVYGIAGVTQIRSQTRFGLSQVVVVFEEGTDIFRARQMVSERIQAALTQLPKGAAPKLGPISTGLGEVYQYTVDAEKEETGLARVHQLMELRALQDWVIKPRLLTVKGITEVNTIGGYEKQFHVQPIAQKMANYGIQFSDIQEALEKTNKNVGGNYVEQSAEQFLIQATGLFKTSEEIKRVPVKSLHSLKTVTIGDIATVALGKELRTGAALVNGKEGIMGTAMMLLGENSRTVSLAVSEKIKDIQKELPAGIKITPLYTRYKLVNATLGTVEHNLLTGAILVILVLVLLVGNLRAALITAFTIPLTLLITFLIMKPLGMSGNLMSLGALDFGIIVDGTVIVLDNCVRMLSERAHELKRALKKNEILETVYDATSGIRQAAGFGELIIVLIFIPIFALEGIAGKMFKPMAGTFSIAVAIALVMSFTTVPALASLVFNGKVEEKEPKLMEIIKHWYIQSLRKILKKKKVTIVSAIGSVILGVILFLSLGGEFLPQLGEGALDLDALRPINISLSQSLELQKKTEEVIRSFKEVRHTYSRVGTAEVATDPMGVHQSDTYVIFWEKEKWKNLTGIKRTPEELVEAISARLNLEVPGQKLMFSQPIQMRFNELLEGTRASVAVKIFGDDLKTLSKISQEVRETIEEVPGAGDVQSESLALSRMLRVDPKHDILTKMGISTQEIQDTVSIAMNGEEAGYLYEGQRRFPIVIRLNEEDREDLADIKRLPVGIASNVTASLDQVANLYFDETYGLIFRENSSRRTAVLVNPRGRDTESFVSEAQKRVEEKVKLPSGYRLEWGGDFKNLREARKRLYIVIPLVLIAVLFVIYMAFQNLFQSLLIFSCVPLALVGGVLGLMINGQPFSISAGVGFIALSGIAVLNGVVLMNYFNDLKASGMKGQALVEKGTSIRLRPVLMTALVDIFGFLPMVVSSGVGAEVQSPLATVVVGGILSSTLLTLVVLPTLYLIFEKKMTSD